MRRVAAIAALTMLAIAGLGAGAAPAQAATGSPRITPIAMKPLGDPRAAPVIGTDNALHALYELAVVNTRSVPVAIDRIDVRTTDPRATVASFEGAALVTRLRHVDGTPLTEAVLAPSEQVVLFVDVGLVPGVERPLLVDHRVTIGVRQFNLAGVTIEETPAVALQSPVLGRNWVVTEGCCGPTSPDRTTVYSTEAGYSTPGRYAIELAQMDDGDRFVTGDPTQLTSYPSYGQYVYAAASGRVAAVVDAHADQVPGTVAPLGTFDEETALGNVVVLDLGGGRYASYGALRPGSIIVRPGQFVRRGQPLAQIGNSGDSTTPHLHFEVLSSPDRLVAGGMPFVLTSFGYAGRIDPTVLADRGLAGPYSDSRLPVAQARSSQLPLAQSIIDLEAAAGSSGNPLL